MKMKKLVAAALAAAMSLSLAACGGGGGAKSNPPAGSNPPAASNPAASTPAASGAATEITAWIYPVGGWTEESNVKPLIMEGPERLVANWGAKGYMVDLSDMIDDTDRAEINPAALAACTSTDGKIYQYPMFITAHCMGINLDAFKAAGADQYLNLDNHTWTTDGFIKAVEALYAAKKDTVAAVYCKGQGGDQGTRALINNMYGGTFTDAGHTKYTWDDPNNIKALEQLKSMPGIAFDASLEGGDELKLMYQEILDMAFCWNIAQQLDPAQAHGDPGKTINGKEIGRAHV